MSSISGPIGDATSSNDDLEGAVTERQGQTESSAEMDRKQTDDDGEIAAE
jgi:hypothetical protein